MALQVIFAGKRLIAAGFGTDKRSLLVVASHMRFETAWSVETLRACRADVIPGATGLALGPQGTIVGVVDLVIGGIV